MWDVANGTIYICTHFGCDSKGIAVGATDFGSYRLNLRSHSQYEKMSIWILSQQQRRVLQLAACGFNKKEIARFLAISESAVRSSENQIHIKFDVCCRIQAIFTGIKLGEISELHAYHYVEARQITNYLADSKQ